MKRIFKIALPLLLAAWINLFGVSAQEKGYGAIGSILAVGTGNDYTNFGIGAKLQYNVMHPLRVEGAVTGFFRKDYITMTDASLHLHYLAFLNDQFCVYPLLGAGVTYSILGPQTITIGGVEQRIEKTTTTKLFGSIGGGVDCWLTDVIILNFEAKYNKYDKTARWCLQTGISYLF